MQLHLGFLPQKPLIARAGEHELLGAAGMGVDIERPHVVRVPGIVHVIVEFKAHSVTTQIEERGEELRRCFDKVDVRFGVEIVS